MALQVAARRRRADLVRGRRHRRRHRARQARVDLRGLPAGRRHDVAQVRRHGPGPVDQPRDLAPARRRDPRRRRASATGRPSRSSCRWPTAPAARARQLEAPAEPPLAAPPRRPSESAALLPYDGVEDDRGAIVAGDRVLLVIAHDAGHAQGALAVAREHGFKGLVARRTPLGLALAREYRPDAVLVFAGDGRGERLLGQLKSHPETRHRPVVVAGPAGGRLAALRAGAAAYVDEADGAEAADGRVPPRWRRSTRWSA